MSRHLNIFLVLTLGCSALAETPEEIQKLVVNLGASEHATREAASKRLLAIGEQAVPLLKPACQSKDPEVQLRAQEIVAQVTGGDLGDPDPAMLARVEDLLQPVRSSGHENLQVIVAIGKRTTPALVSIANRTRGPQNLYAMIALTRLADSRSFPALAELFQVPDMAQHMTGYIAQIKNPQMLKALIALWEKLGENASDRLRQQVRKMSKQELGDDPAAYTKWFAERHENTRNAED